MRGWHHQEGLTGDGGPPSKLPAPRNIPAPDLPAEASALSRAQEVGIGLVGSGDDSGHSALVSGG